MLHRFRLLKHLIYDGVFLCVSVKFSALMSSVHSQPVYVNALQASLPNLSLIDPPHNSGVSIQ